MRKKTERGRIKEKKSEENFSISTEEEESTYNQYPGDKASDSYQHSFFLERSLEQEIERSKADGLMEDDLELNSFEISGGKQGIRSIGTALVGEEKSKVNTLSDNGSTGCFVTHSQGRRSKLEKKRITTL